MKDETLQPTDTNEIQKITKTYFVKLYSTKFGNIKEINEFQIPINSINICSY